MYFICSGTLVHRSQKMPNHHRLKQKITVPFFWSSIDRESCRASYRDLFILEKSTVINRDAKNYNFNFSLAVLCLQFIPLVYKRCTPWNHKTKTQLHKKCTLILDMPTHKKYDPYKNKSEAWILRVKSIISLYIRHLKHAIQI